MRSCGSPARCASSASASAKLRGVRPRVAAVLVDLVAGGLGQQDRAVGEGLLHRRQEHLALCRAGGNDAARLAAFLRGDNFEQGSWRGEHTLYFTRSNRRRAIKV